MNYFSTVRFNKGNPLTKRNVTDVETFVTKHKMKYPDTPLYLTYEQKGGTKETMGAAPHIHISVLQAKKSYKRMVDNLFSTEDVYTEIIDNVGAMYRIIHRFQKRMDKKGRSPVEKSLTRVWRNLMSLPASVSHGKPADVVQEMLDQENT